MQSDRQDIFLLAEAKYFYTPEWGLLEIEWLGQCLYGELLYASRLFILQFIRQILDCYIRCCRRMYSLAGLAVNRDDAGPQRFVSAAHFISTCVERTKIE